jgi:3-hydroxybutyryl-CoA dehydratase
MSYIRRKAVTGLEAGDTFSVSRTFSEQDMMRFADISRDYNPVHFDERYAKTKNFDGRICHGLLISSLITEIGGQIGWLASAMNFKFKKPVYFDETVKCDFTITHIDEKGRAEAEAVFTNEHDMIVLEATIAGILPGTKEKQVIEDMLAAGDPTNKI